LTKFEYHLIALCMDVEVVVKESIVKHQFAATFDH